MLVIKLLKDLRTILPAASILLFLTSLGYYYWPPVWPDEVLFSSPAADLANNGTFTTPVLYGLIPGMEEGTLWNSPLFMVLTAGVYYFFGESLEAGRALSFVIGLFALFTFSRLLRRFTGSERVIAVASMFLAFDPVFLRASNVIRMDMLTLLFILIAFYHMIREREIIDNQPGDDAYFRVHAFIAGLATGLAGISHPFSVILVPIWIIMIFPAIRSLMNGLTGGMIGFFPWAVYIINHLEIFRVQFLSQLFRKKSMATLWGGDTGGVFVVFSSQYGGGKIAMVFALLAFAAFSLWMVRMILAGRKSRSRSFAIRLFLTFVILMSFIMLSSEGWYALYASPFALILSVAFYSWAESEMFISHNISKAGLAIIGIPLFVLSFMFYFKNTYKKDSAAAVANFLNKSVTLIQDCESVYIRTRPDPYFHVRRYLPETVTYEFVPGKLRFSNEFDRAKKYREIECFYLDENHSWEPELHAFLMNQKDDFDRFSLTAEGPAEPATLWKRRTVAE